MSNYIPDEKFAYLLGTTDSGRSTLCTLSTPISDSTSRGGSRFGVINDSPEQRLDSVSVPRTMPSLISDSTSRGGSKDSVSGVNQERSLPCLICTTQLKGRDWVQHCAEHCAQYLGTGNPLRCHCYSFGSWELLFTHIWKSIHDDENVETYGTCGEEIRRQLSLGVPRSSSGASEHHRDHILRRGDTPAYSLFRDETIFAGAWVDGRPDGNGNNAE